MVLDRALFVGKIFTPEEAAEALQMHPDSVRRMIRAGRLKAHRPEGGKSYFITGENLLRLLTGEKPQSAERHLEDVPLEEMAFLVLKDGRRFPLQPQKDEGGADKGNKGSK